jgi:homoserine O-acetyltransferase
MPQAGNAYEVFEVADFALHKGGRLSPARIAYTTHGTLSHKRDNAILFPTWFSSTHRNNTWLIGEGRALDPRRFFVVVPNLLGNGLSSSPSNTAAPFDGSRFPRITMLDNVRLQQRLLEERFGIERVVAVIGRSMGAQAAFQWGSYFPERLGSLLALCGSSKTTPHNQAFLEGVKAAVPAGMRAVGRLYAGWAMSQAFYRQGLHLAEGFASLEDYLRAKWDRNFEHMDAEDLLAMVRTWQGFDLSDNERYNGDWPAALRAIACKAIVMPSRTDLYFPPEDSAAAVAHMPNAELRVLESVWGHRAGGPNSDPKDIAFIEEALRDLLQL